MFDVHCYERIEPDLWHLRAQFVFAHSPIMQVEFTPDGEFVNVVHDGQISFKIRSTAEQTRKNRIPASRTNGE